MEIDDILAEPPTPEDTVDVARRARLSDALILIMGQRAGRRLVYAQLAHCGLLTSSFSSDPLVMAFNEGRREVAVWMLDLIDQHCPEEFARMMNESKEDDYHDRNSLES